MILELVSHPFVTSVALAATQQTPEPEFNNDDVTPGVVGFIATAFIAVMAILLAIDMIRRVRRVRYRSEVDEMLDAELHAAGLDDAASDDAAVEAAAHEAAAQEDAAQEDAVADDTGREQDPRSGA